MSNVNSVEYNNEFYRMWDRVRKNLGVIKAVRMSDGEVMDIWDLANVGYGTDDIVAVEVCKFDEYVANGNSCEGLTGSWFDTVDEKPLFN